MHIGLMMECDYRNGRSQEEAFEDVFATAASAEEFGFDGVWLAERHFAPPGGVRPVPSVVASPLIIATAIAARTSRIRVGTAVLVLPLGHPVRMAEEVATIDNISQGRLDLGIGRSGLPWSYSGYDIPYSESRDRFNEFFDVMKLAWTQDQFSYEGKYYTFQDVPLVPKPYQKPYPPLRYAATSRETYSAMGTIGMPIFVGIGRSTIADLGAAISEYRQAWKQAGHPGEGDVMLRIGTYVAEDMGRALFEPKDSTLFFYDRMGGPAAQSAQSWVDETSAAPSAVPVWRGLRDAAAGEGGLRHTGRCHPPPATDYRRTGPVRGHHDSQRGRPGPEGTVEHVHPPVRGRSRAPLDHRRGAARSGVT